MTESLEIQEGVERMKQEEVIEGREQTSKKGRYVAIGLATLGAFALQLRQAALGLV